MNNRKQYMLHYQGTQGTQGNNLGKVTKITTWNSIIIEFPRGTVLALIIRLYPSIRCYTTGYALKLDVTKVKTLMAVRWSIVDVDSNWNPTISELKAYRLIINVRDLVEPMAHKVGDFIDGQRKIVDW